jgi:Acetyltransferase (GNAT) domain
VESLPDGPSNCTDADLAAYQRFIAQMFGEHHFRTENDYVHDDYIRWIFGENPAAEGRNLWIYRQGGKIVASRGSIPFELKAGDTTYSAAWAVDVTTDPSVRRTGVAYELASAAGANDGGIRGGLALSDDGYRFATRQGFTDMGRVTRYVCPIDAGSLRQHFGDSKIVRWFAGPSMSIFSPIVTISSRVGRDGTQLSPVGEFDDRSETVWRKVSLDYPVISKRDLRWLRWRFDLSPEKDQYRRYYLTKNDDSCGYLVLRAVSWHGLPGMEIVDYLAAPRDLPSLFGWAIDIARREGMAVLTCTTLNSKGRWPLRRLGFVGRSSETRFVMRVPDSDGNRELLLDPASWFLTPADSDLEFCLLQILDASN